MAQHFANTNLATPGAPIWAEGDFNYDGKINALDFNAVATNFGAAAIPAGGVEGAALGALVPEPASIGMVAMMASGLVARRRRVNTI